jgi:diguanylate cyclase
VTIVVLGIVLGAVQLAAGIVIGRYLPVGRDRHRSSDRPEPSDLEPFARRLYGLVTGATSETLAPDEAPRQISALADLEGPRPRESSLSDAANPLADAVFRLVAKVIRLNRGLQTRLFEAEEKLRRQSEQIRCHAEEARTDALTGLLNRRAFDDELGRRVSQWRRKRTPCCLMMVDIDYFKVLNDRHGHPGGDRVLQALARILLDAVREMDFVARFGGEEFAVVLPDTALDDAEIVAERLRLTVESTPIQVEDDKILVTVSSGLAVTVEADDAASLIARADAGLYASKHAGRNCTHSQRPSGCERIQVDVEPASRWSLAAAKAAPEPVLDPELEAACTELRERLAEFTGRG